MDIREERGKAIAAMGRVKKTKQELIYEVPSQSGPGAYLVNLASGELACTCPAYEERQKACKHVYAVAYTVVQQENADGSVTVTETVTVARQRKTYPQNWTAYNAAQTNEQDKFQELLRDLCAGIPEPHVQRRGRPSVPLADAIFAAAFKVYSGFSGRRFMSDLRESHKRGMISRVPHYNSIFNYLEDDGLTPILVNLIRQSSAPLAGVEVDFAVDSSGFSTSRFTRWYDHKYGALRTKADWVKAHVICGVRTHIITAIEIGEKTAGDSPFLAPLVKTTAKMFSIFEVSADKAYVSDKNTNSIASFNATPFIPFRSNVKGNGSVLWEHLYHYFMFNKAEFLQHHL